MKFHISKTVSSWPGHDFCVSFVNSDGKLVEEFDIHPEDAMRKVWSRHFEEIMEVIKNEARESEKERQKEVRRTAQDESVRSILHTHTKSLIEREREIAETIEFEEEFQEGQTIFLTWVNQHDTMGHCALWTMNASRDDLENARRHFDAQSEYHFVNEIVFCDKDIVHRLPFQAITLAGRNYIEEKAHEHRKKVLEV